MRLLKLNCIATVYPVHYGLQAMKRQLLVACIMLVLVACSPIPASSKAFDNRDPDVIYAEGIIEGTQTTTLKTMTRFQASFVEWYRENANEAGFPEVLFEYSVRLKKLSAYLKELSLDPEKGKTLVAKSPKIRKMYDLIAELDEPFSKMLRMVGAKNGKLN